MDSLKKVKDTKTYSMKNNSKKVQYIIISVILSLLVHIFVLSLFENIRVKQNFISDLKRQKSKIITFSETNIINLKRFNEIEKSINIPEFLKKTPFTPTATKVKPFLFPTKNTSNELHSSPIIPPYKFESTLLNKVPILPITIHFDGDKLTEKELKYNHQIIPKIERKKYNPPFLYETSIEYSKIAKTKYPNSAIKDVPLKLRFSPPKIQLYNEPVLESETKLVALQETTPIDPFLQIKLYKYPESNGNGYFKINISTNKNAANFKIINKDIIFMIDISGSIVDKQLAEFVKGIALSLPNLNSRDRFEIIAFKDKPFPLFGDLETPTKMNIKKALIFLNKLHQTGSTNLYKALNPFVDSRYQTAKRPLLIFMLSDGKLNTGEIVNNRNFINTISNKNQSASIFTFTNVKNSNAFLLDLLAYRNRGIFTHTNTTDNSHKLFKNDIRSTSNIILMNLNYQISSSLSSKTFPKKLPNLYMKQNITLFGQYQSNTDKVSLRITGTSEDGSKHELIYSESLHKALNGSKTLPTQWAQQYIFHLYSKLTANYNEKTKQKIYSIANKYSIPTSSLKQYLMNN